MRTGSVATMVAAIALVGCAAPGAHLSCPTELAVGETGTATTRFQDGPDIVRWSIGAGDGEVRGIDRDGVHTAEITPFDGPQLVVVIRAQWIKFVTGTDEDGVDVGFRIGSELQCRIEVPVPNPSTTSTTSTTSTSGPPPSTEPPPSSEPPASTISPTGATRRLFDDVAGDSNWASTVSNESGGATYEAGNPMVHRLPGAADASTFITVEHVFRGGGWDPATDGPLSHLVYSVTRQQVAPPFEGAAIGDAFAIWQDGERFVHFLDEGGSFTNTSPETTTTGKLTAADFEPAPGPDFSAGGGSMKFGFVRSNTNDAPVEIVTQHTATDWTVELLAADG